MLFAHKEKKGAFPLYHTELLENTRGNPLILLGSVRSSYLGQCHRDLAFPSSPGKNGGLVFPLLKKRSSSFSCRLSIDLICTLSSFSFSYRAERGMNGQLRIGTF